MNKTYAAKVVAHNMTSFAVSSATTGVLRNNIRPSSNPVVNLAINASVFVGSWFVSGTLLEPVQEHTDREIDKIAAALSAFKKN